MQISTDGLDASFPPLRSLDAFPGNLPMQRTAFVGRRRELREIATLLDDAAVVTLIGVGGVGKTRLARHAAHYRELATVIGDGLQGPDESAWRARYETELENLRGAVTWFASTDDADNALGLVFDLFALHFIATQTIDDLAVAALEAPSSSGHPLGPSAMVFAADHAVQDGQTQQGAAMRAAVVGRWEQRPFSR